ncbi:hypothetical protein [Clostridium massiliamazoniense]|uniref:hypothetical protein n=1 Tax=Clostridium massiliamazoniense TaxID=1347366 RepID=UPI0006D7C8E2|nr:hypothetical protein [Clostridium massiliamazoniense]
MGESVNEKLEFLLEENILVCISAISILLSIFFNVYFTLWGGIFLYIIDNILKRSLMKSKKKNKLENGQCKIIDFDFIEKKIK